MLDTGRNFVELAALRDRQQAWIEKFKQDVIEKMQKEGRTDENAQ